VIDVGEAMVSVDVNSGRTTGASALEETAIKTNLEAAEEITRQLRLRDLGGLIVIDFIDMFQKKNKALLEKQVKLSCKRDRARVNISRISRFGLLEMSRQRLAPPVKEGFFSDCLHCGGTGHVKTDSSTALSVIRKIQEHLAVGNVKVLQVMISTQVANYLLNKKMKSLLDLEEKNGVDILFESQEHLPYENFSFTVLERKKEEDRVIEQKSRIQRDSKPEGEEAQEEKGEKRSRGRRPSTGRGRGRRPSTTVRERKKEEDKVIEQESSMQGDPKPEKEGSPEGKGEKDSRVRRPSSGRGRGRRPSTGSRSGTRKPTRSTRKRPWKSSRTKEGASPEMENKSSAAESPRENITSTRDSTGSAPPSPPKFKPERESNEERQPRENVSRLHEMVVKSPPPFDPGPNRK
jgi:ribonuclease E